jgi:3-deoxy-D-manno-octulosonate 8-phosphate phosphatase (KDO 8-P phosphatase)
MKKNILNLFKKVKLLVLDVDGVLTRGEIIYDDKGREFKIFNVKDGLGIVLLGKAGIGTILLTAKDSAVVRRRAVDMRVKEVIAGVMPKESVLNDLKKRYKVSEEEICFIGDDLIDLALMEKVGLPVTVNDAPAVIQKAARFITQRNGGEGAVREVVDLILQAQHLEEKVYSLLKHSL